MTGPDGPPRLLEPDQSHPRTRALSPRPVWRHGSSVWAQVRNAAVPLRPRRVVRSHSPRGDLHQGSTRTRLRFIEAAPESTSPAEAARALPPRPVPQSPFPRSTCIEAAPEPASLRTCAGVAAAPSSPFSIPPGRAASRPRPNPAPLHRSPVGMRPRPPLRSPLPGPGCVGAAPNPASLDRSPVGLRPRRIFSAEALLRSAVTHIPQMLASWC